MEEIWKDVVGYEGLYQVSNFGKVKSLNYKRLGVQRDMTLRDTSVGYFMVLLRKNGKGASKYVHRLVADAFLDNPEDKKCVNHKDGDKHNNLAENLEWVTYKENTVHAVCTGLRKSSTKFGELTHSKGFTAEKLADLTGASVRTLEGYMSGRNLLRNARADFFCKLSDALGMTAFELFDAIEG